MQRYKRLTNIPMEVLRSVVSIADAGSLSKAASVLCLSQPALSAQIKKIEVLVGGNIFKKTPGGSSVTELGKLVVMHARRIVESNDQLLRLRGDNDTNQSIRLGISNLYAERFFEKKGRSDPLKISIVADHSSALLTSFLAGFIDAAMVLISGDIEIDVSLHKISERETPLTWVRSPDFVLSPGAPIPLLTWPGQVISEVMTRALEEAGMIYRLAFSSPDHHATLAAARSGAGLLVLPADMLLSGLVRAKEYYLPELSPLRLILCARAEAVEKQPDIIKFLAASFFDHDAGNGDPTQAGGVRQTRLGRSDIAR